MMTASSDLKGTSTGRSTSSIRLASSQEANRSTNDATDDDFGSFAAAAVPSDPFGDVYGAEADFGGFLDQEQSTSTITTVDHLPMIMFSPQMAPESPTAPPTLFPSISGEIDPFADITGGLGAVTDDSEGTEGKKEAASLSESCNATNARAAALTSTSAILDLVWGQTTQESESDQLSKSLTAVTSTVDRLSRRASSPSSIRFLTKYATVSKSGTSGTAKEDLLSFSPVQAPLSNDPFGGLSHDCVETNKDLLSLTTTMPSKPTTSISEPTSLRGSFISLHDDVKPSVVSIGLEEKAALSCEMVAKQTTRSSRSLSSSSFVSVGAIEDSSWQQGLPASFQAFTHSTRDPVTSASPLSAPSSSRSSLPQGLVGPTTAVFESSNQVDPFEQAGLTATEEVPLAEALATWNTSVEADVVSEEEKNISEEEEKKITACTAQKEDSQDGASEGTDSIDQQGDSGDIMDGTKPAVAKVDESLTDGVTTTCLSDVRDEKSGSDGFTRNQQDVHSIDTLNATGESKRRASIALTEWSEMAPVSEATDRPFIKKSEARIDAGRLRDENYKSDNSVFSGSHDQGPVEQITAEHNTESLEASQLNLLATSADFAASRDGLDDASLHYDSLSASLSSSDPTQADTFITFDNHSGDTKVKPLENDMRAMADNATEDNFGSGGARPSIVNNASTTLDSSAWGSASSPLPVQNMLVEEDAKVSFGDFSGTTAAFADTNAADFAQSIDEEDFGDFGDFTPTFENDDEDFTDFQQSDSQPFDDDDDDFGEFAPAVAPTFEVQVEPLVFNKTELSNFFQEALATEPVPTRSVAQSESCEEVMDEDEAVDSSIDSVRDVFRSMWDEYISIMVTTGRLSTSSTGSLSSTTDYSTHTERVRLDRKTRRASKYLKYVLSEKIQEVSRQNGIFAHGSEKHAMYIGCVTSGDAERMRAALAELHEAQFQSLVNEAMMRIAKQAALSAKAKIAEQAAQYASLRGGSLFSTTRQLLSRGGTASGAHGPGSSGNDTKGDHAGADTPTGASVQKLARFSFTTSHDDTGTSHRGTTAIEERGSEGSDHTGHSSGSDSEVATSAGDSRTRSQISSSSNGGLMRKFQDRFSFTGSRHRIRFVNLRRQGQSSEEVQKMELNLDAISGGLDEVKWKCAMFLYDAEEVAHVAPSQISLLSYPSNQPLTGKTDRSALTKLVKPPTIWTVDIGANHSDMLNEW